MGNYCCSDCQRTRENQFLSTPPLLQKATDQDEPRPQVARPVTSMIEIHPKVKEIHMLPHHSSERKGVKLPLYYIFQYCAYYEGEWKNGVPHGFGTICYDDGSMYEGCFKHGVAECKDALFIKDPATFYKGSIKNNKANGYGELSTPKLFYKGNWVNDLPQGKARQIYSSASFYEGNFVDGIKEGDGIYQWNKNEYYIGKFSNNLFEGEGDLTTKDYHYRGTFVQGKKEGKGWYKDLATKFIYSGSFKDNKPAGEGQITYEDGAVAKGQFDGFENIKGVLTVVSGEAIPLNIKCKSNQ